MEYKAILWMRIFRPCSVKALERKGTYKQIADAAFHCPSLKNCLIKNHFENIMQGVQRFVFKQHKTTHCVQTTHLCCVKAGI